MKCPQCGNKVNDNEELCPTCGAILHCAQGEEDCFDEQPRRRKNKAAIIIAGVILVIAAAAFGIYQVFFADRYKSPETPPTADEIVATYNGHTLTNRELNYYYWSDYYYLSSYNSDGSYFDPTLPLSEQTYDGVHTWESYFVDSAIKSWKEIMSASDEAEAKGFELPSDYQDALDTSYDDIAQAAEGAGMSGGVKQYLVDSYGPASDYDTFKSFITDNYYANAYSNTIYDSMWEAQEANSPTSPTINIRHILIKTGTDEAAAKTKADEIYALWQQNPTEENFAELAEEHTEDGGSATTGGLYEGVMPGEMIDEFDAWCFEDGRAHGDSGIVKTYYGYHIMFFSGQGEPTAVVDEDVVFGTYSRWLESVTANDVERFDDKIQIYAPVVETE